MCFEWLVGVSVVFGGMEQGAHSLTKAFVLYHVDNGVNEAASVDGQ